MMRRPSSANESAKSERHARPDAGRIVRASAAWATISSAAACNHGRSCGSGVSMLRPPNTVRSHWPHLGAPMACTGSLGASRSCIGAPSLVAPNQENALRWTEIEAEVAFVDSQITKCCADFLVIHPMYNGFLMDLGAPLIIQMEDQFDDIIDLQGVG